MLRDRGRVPVLFFVLSLTLCCRTPCPNSLAKSLKFLASALKSSFPFERCSCLKSVSCLIFVQPLFRELFLQCSGSLVQYTSKRVTAWSTVGIIGTHVWRQMTWTSHFSKILNAPHALSSVQLGKQIQTGRTLLSEMRNVAF